MTDTVISLDFKHAKSAVANAAAQKRETKQKILQIIANKRDEALQNKSLEELQALANAM